MMPLLSVALGGAIGAMMRFWMAAVLNSADYKLPYATLTCNILGSLIMGVLFVLIMEKGRLPAELRPLLMTGMLGAFTTFSTFSLETVSMLHEGHVAQALIYILLSVVFSIVALYGGIWITRLF